MSLKQFSKEQLQEMSLIEMAYEYLKNSTQAVSFNQLMNDIATTVNLSEDEVKTRIAQFYTDMNIDGRFLALGENRWGLRVWYPVDTAEEEVVTAVKAKKKKTKKVVDESDLDEYDELDEDLEYEDLDEFSDDEDLIEDDDSFDEDADEVDEFEDDDDVMEDEEEYDLEDDELEEELVDDELEEEDEEDL